MPVSQPQRKPTGIALDLAKKIGAVIQKEAKTRKGRLDITHVLRALEWTRYTITEQCVRQIGDVPGE